MPGPFTIPPAAALLVLLMLLVGCSDAPQDQSMAADAAGAPTAMPDNAAQPQMVVHLSPACGCCTDWVEHMRADGFGVRVQYESDITTIRRLLGVPDQLASCHTAVIDGYLIEGHVPAADVRRLLDERPTGALGIAAPGMPFGSPGMEIGDRRDAYDVLLFDRERARVFTHHPGGS
jgi:hypothetical protein